VRGAREGRIDEVLRTARFLVDTNIVSHVIREKSRLDPGIAEFFDRVDEERLYLSTLTIGEIQKRIDLVAARHPDLREELEVRLEMLCDRFDGRMVTPDLRVARQWGRFHAEREGAGRKTPAVDTLLAASAYVHRLAIVSADGDFAAFGKALTVYNPRTRTLSG
jgi:predicted nucleic acid-binding protein